MRFPFPARPRAAHRGFTQVELLLTNRARRDSHRSVTARGYAGGKNTGTSDATFGTN